MNHNTRYTLIYYLGVFILLLIIAVPLCWNLLISITPEKELLTPHAYFLPPVPDYTNYIRLATPGTKESSILFNALGNSLILSAITLAIAMPTAIATSYALTRYTFAHKNLIKACILSTLIIPVATTIIPIYSLYRFLHITDTLWGTALIYVSALLPIAVWLGIQYFQALPQELWQAAELDGFTEKQLFFYIILPLSRPLLLTMGLIMFLLTWKQFMIPAILLSSTENRVMTVALSAFITKHSIPYTLIAACGFIAILPPAISAIVFRKYVISGLLSGSTKQP